MVETWKHHPEMLQKAREYLRKSTGSELNIPKNLAHASDVIYKFRNEIAAYAIYKLVNHLTGEPLKIVDHIWYATMSKFFLIIAWEVPNVLVFWLALSRLGEVYRLTILNAVIVVVLGSGNMLLKSIGVICYRILRK